MKENSILVEVCADSVSSAVIAQSAGAYRVEFCANLKEGGTTPSLGQIKIARELLNIRLYVLVRPRGGDFLYDHREWKTIEYDIHSCGEMGCDGIVTGMLLPDGTVDKERMYKLILIARQYGMGITFHRAFDRSVDLFQAMEDIIDLGCERILTSGGYNTAIEGIEILQQLIEKANKRIVIMPGAGITPENASLLIQKTGLKELHGTFRARIPSRMQYKNRKLSNQEEEYSSPVADAEKIQTICKICKNTC
jgi:copper homeostasis protein